MKRECLLSRERVIMARNLRMHDLIPFVKGMGLESESSKTCINTFERLDPQITT